MKNVLHFIVLFIVLSCNTQVKSNTQKKDNFVINKQTGVTLFEGTLERLEHFSSKFIKERPVDVWLPKNYTKEKKYNVLYMHDGQMLFDSTKTWNKQEWKIDELSSKLIKEKKVKDFIIVGIHNIANIRWQDLFPQKAYDYIDEEAKKALKSISGSRNFTLNGDNYLKFIVKELKPFIDSKYAVHTDKDHTFIMGSSMGGLMSMYAISEYPKIFSGAACLSTHWVGAMPMDDNPFPEAILKYMADNLPNSGEHKIYFDYGNKTLDQHYPQYAPKVDEILKQKGYSESDSKNLLFEGTNHSEISWSKRLDIPLLFLLKK
ncbi:alpha/beta hydrolase [Tenacibaculum jejuense]|uniref:Probable lipoprotein n=1 Tax=Tenacibaculum jejuense TaxID=584609 RepID=A0A238UA07_9FLAO|nr:alpha/beta fold hydrolase [Tenacibaculum jejuense]SNR15826.1 Probable lipoprotein precursor [Tenacibaculum jejuense]